MQSWHPGTVVTIGRSEPNQKFSDCRIANRQTAARAVAVRHALPLSSPMRRNTTASHPRCSNLQHKNGHQQELVSAVKPK